MISNFVPRAFLCLALGGGQALGTRLYDLATRSLPQMKDYPSLSIGLNELNILSKSRYNVDLILVMYYISAGQTSLLQVQ